MKTVPMKIDLEEVAKALENVSKLECLCDKLPPGAYTSDQNGKVLCPRCAQIKFLTGMQQALKQPPDGSPVAALRPSATRGGA